MKKNEFGTSVKMEFIGSFNLFPDRNLHNAKSFAGKTFHTPEVKSVCVFDHAGKVHLYLKKNADGSITREVAGGEVIIGCW